MKFECKEQSACFLKPIRIGHIAKKNLIHHTRTLRLAQKSAQPPPTIPSETLGNPNMPHHATFVSACASYSGRQSSTLAASQITLSSFLREAFLLSPNLELRFPIRWKAVQIWTGVNASL